MMDAVAGRVHVAWDNETRAFVAVDPTRRDCRATGFTAMLAVKNLEQEQAAFGQKRKARLAATDSQTPAPASKAR